VPIENRNLLLAVELRLRIECLSRQIVNYVLVCAVSRESRLKDSMRNLYLSRSKYPDLQGAVHVAVSLLEEVNFVPIRRMGNLPTVSLLRLKWPCPIEDSV